MSYVPKMLKGDPSLDLNLSLGKMEPKPDLTLNPKDTIKVNPPKDSDPLPSEHVMDRDDREYGCNYCPKKFSNKQALGGHQNAHKVEKVVAKRTWQGHETKPAYNRYQSYNGMTPFPFLSSFNHAPKNTINPVFMNSPHYLQYMQPEIHTHGYPGPMFPTSHEPHVVQDLQELSSFYVNPVDPQFMSFHTWIGQGSTSAGKFSADANNDQAEHSSQGNSENQQSEDMGIDLSLKL